MEGAATTTSSVIDTVGAALTSGLTEAAAGMVGVLADLLPVALAVMTGVLTVSYGIKIFKKITGR